MLGNKITKKTSQILVAEHENILKVVEKLEIATNELEKSKKIDKLFFTKAVDFIRNYADKYHHAKEEDILFKEFNKCAEEDSGAVHCNPVEQMFVEHDEGRKFVKLIEKGVNENSPRLVIEGSRGYVQLIKEHIFKEDNILYPMADAALSKDVENKMLQKFKEIKKSYGEKESKYLSFAKSSK